MPEELNTNTVDTLLLKERENLELGARPKSYTRNSACNRSIPMVIIRSVCTTYSGPCSRVLVSNNCSLKKDSKVLSCALRPYMILFLPKIYKILGSTLLILA